VMAPISFSAQDVCKMRETLAGLHDDIGHYLSDSGMDPKPNSLAEIEQAHMCKAEQLSVAYSQGQLLIESAADHALAVTRLLVQPVQTLAPWSCLRVSLESAAFSCWLLSEKIDAKERIARSLAYRYEGVSQQLKLARACGETRLVGEILARMDKIADDARTGGYSARIDKKGRRIGVATVLPSATQCVTDVLGEGNTYRISSGVVHADMSVLVQVGFRHAKDAGRGFVEKSLSCEYAAFIVWKAATALARSVWARAVLFGYDLDCLSRILETGYCEIGLRKEMQFWGSA
jgi:hypothetical protein